MTDVRSLIIAASTQFGCLLADALGYPEQAPASAEAPYPDPLAPMTGVYVGNDPADLAPYETWLGRNVDAVQLHFGFERLGSDGWADVKSTWLIEQWAHIYRRKLWCVPLIPAGATLEAAAAGDYDHHYIERAQSLLAASPASGPIYARFGWEFNLAGWPWSAKGKVAAYSNGLRSMCLAFRAVSPRFVIEFCPHGQGEMERADIWDCYPGDDCIDVIGTDIYWDDWNPADPYEQFENMKWQPWGLERVKEFALLHGKRQALAEWGVKRDTAGPLIELVHNWGVANNFLYLSYWESDSGYQGKLSDDRHPQAALAYKDAFG